VGDPRFGRQIEDVAPAGFSAVGIEAVMAEPQRVVALPGVTPAIEEPPAESHVRSVTDVMRLIIAAIVVLFGLLLATGVSNTLVGFDRDVLGLFDGMPVIVERVLIGTAQLVSTNLFPLAIVVLVLIRRRYRLLGMLALAFLAGEVVLHLIDIGVVSQVGRPALLAAIHRPGWIAGSAWPSSAYLAGLVAAVTVAEPWASRAWKRAAWAVVLLVLVLRVVSGTNLPSDLVLALGVGMACGSALLLIFGAPNKQPYGAMVAAALDRAGLSVVRLKRAAVDARSSTPYFGLAADGRPLFVKVLGYDDRDKNLMFRLYRRLRFKDVGEHAPFTSLQRLVEHEALVALYANDGGIHTPRLLAVTDVEDRGFLLAYERIEGDSLDNVGESALTDGVLRRTWLQVRELQRERIAHRDLRLANVFLANDGHPWMIDFGFGEVAATNHMLDTDVAELLASTAAKVGAKRAVDAAIAVLGKGPVASAAPRIQPPALTRATSQSLAAQKPLCSELRNYAAEASDAGDIEPVRLERVRPRTILTFAALAVATYLLIPQLIGVASYWSVIVNANWVWGLWAVLASALSYVAGTFALKGSVSVHVPFLGGLAARLAGAFFNRITPAGLGGIGTTVRYLQKRGVDLAVASSSAALNALSGILMTLGLAAAFLAWAGARNGGSLSHLLPGMWLLILIGAGLAALGVLALIPWGRKQLHRYVRPMLTRSAQGIAGIARRPVKLLELFGGQAASQLLSIAALVLSVQAFGGGLSIATVGAIYLVGTTVASAVPVPGGIGAVEVALIAGLTAAGLPRDVAVPAVFLYRIATFWLPILPGWISFTILQRREAL
jgi:undecaprenyl-diphosphatase